MTNTPVPGWYNDPEIAAQLRYWDGEQWTEHIAATAPIAPAMSPYYAPTPQHITLFNNPYEKPPRTPRQQREDALSTRQRVQAAALDAIIVVPFVLIGFFLAPVLGWISGNADARDHAYHAAGLVLAIVLGVGVVFWNFVMRETTLGAEWIARRDGIEDPPNDEAD